MQRGLERGRWNTGCHWQPYNRAHDYACMYSWYSTNVPTPRCSNSLGYQTMSVYRPPGHFTYEVARGPYCEDDVVLPIAVTSAVEEKTADVSKLGCVVGDGRGVSIREHGTISLVRK